jgi:MinD-like ATPase involved in chromosome partitioning or flagellar assembly
MRESSIAIAASGREWALSLHRFVADHGGARVRVRVMHPEQAIEENYDVLVVDDVTSFLTAQLVHHVQRRDRKVLGVYEEVSGENRLNQLGVNAVIEADAEPEEFIALISELASQRAMDEEFADLVAELNEREADGREATTGRIVAVGGAGGGVGATEAAVAIAANLATRGPRVCLVDADDVAPGVAQRLDLPLHPNIRTAMDNIQHREGTVGDTLHQLEDRLTVLPGLPNARDWVDIRSGNVLDVVTGLADTTDVVVVNISSMVEPQGSAIAGDGRFGLSRLILAVADDAVLVADPSPLGIGRVVEWLADTKHLLGEAALHVIVNRFVDGQFAKAEIRQEILSVADTASLTFASWEPKLARAAWEGKQAPRNRFSRAIHEAVDNLTAAPTRRKRGIGSRR